MGVTQAKILDQAVGTEQIADDAVIPADIDETAAYNFSNTSNTQVANSATIATAAIATGNVNALNGTTVTVNTLATGGTNTGYCAGNGIYPTGTSSTAFANSAATALSKVFISPLTDVLSAAGTVLAPFISAKGAGSFTVNVALATSTAFDFDYMIVN